MRVITKQGATSGRGFVRGSLKYRHGKRLVSRVLAGVGRLPGMGVGWDRPSVPNTAQPADRPAVSLRADLQRLFHRVDTQVWGNQGRLAGGAADLPVSSLEPRRIRSALTRHSS